MSIYDQIAARIIQEQELLMGPVAWVVASKVKGLKADRDQGLVAIENGDSKIVVNDLVDRFGSIFGQAGREVCKEAVTALVADMQASQIPSNLK